MRHIETKTGDFIVDYLEDLVRVAKAWEHVNQSNDDIELIACDFGQMYGIEPADFATYEIDIPNISYTEWVGPVPNKPPRIG